MKWVRDETKLRTAILMALRELHTSARKHLPAEGTFPLLRSRFAAEPLVERAGDVEFSVGPASNRPDERERFLDVKVLTPSTDSETATWVLYGSSEHLLKAFEDEAVLAAKVQTAILDGVRSIQMHEFA
jgi:hypothetical protein